MQYFFKNIGYYLLISISCTALVAGCSHTPSDPFEKVNRVTFKINDYADRAVLKPAAQAYRAVVPDLVRQGVNNSLNNLQTVPILANDILQFNLEKALHSSSRLVFNTIFGLGGILDLTTAFKLPRAHQNDLGMTLAFYGWHESSFVVLPLLGPSTIRDGIGQVGDSYARPTRYIDNVRLRNSITGVSVVNTRANFLDIDRTFSDAAVDPYIFQRESYRQYRRASLIRAGVLPDNYDEADGEESIHEFIKQQRE